MERDAGWLDLWNMTDCGDEGTGRSCHTTDISDACHGGDRHSEVVIKTHVGDDFNRIEAGDHNHGWSGLLYRFSSPCFMWHFVYTVQSKRKLDRRVKANNAASIHRSNLIAGGTFVPTKI